MSDDYGLTIAGSAESPWYDPQRWSVSRNPV